MSSVLARETPDLGRDDRHLDQQSFQELYRSTFGFVRQRARWLVRDEDAALDAAQEAFARAWERWPAVTAARSRIGWLLVTVTRICIDRLRHRKMARQRLEPVSIPVSPAATGHLARLLSLRLGQERPLRQQIVIHVWIDGMTHEEAADLLDISTKTVQRQLAAFRDEHAAELFALAEVDHA
jgi:RNA polymerase sigma-70 factor (ECF subfamily)